jgi:hypothetical protein
VQGLGSLKATLGASGSDDDVSVYPQRLIR